MGTRYFDLQDILMIDKMPPTEDIAQLLRSKTWS